MSFSLHTMSTLLMIVYLQCCMSSTYQYQMTLCSSFITPRHPHCCCSCQPWQLLQMQNHFLYPWSLLIFPRYLCHGPWCTDSHNPMLIATHHHYCYIGATTLIWKQWPCTLSMPPCHTFSSLRAYTVFLSASQRNLHHHTLLYMTCMSLLVSYNHPMALYPCVHFHQANVTLSLIQRPSYLKGWDCKWIYI